MGSDPRFDTSKDGPGVTGEGSIALNDSGGPAFIGSKIAGWAITRTDSVAPYDYPSAFGCGQTWGRASASAYVQWYDSKVPPVVTSVIVKRSVPPFASYTVPTGNGGQLRSVPVGGVNQIIVLFSEDVATSPTVTVEGKESVTTYPITTSFPTARALQINLNALIQRGASIPGDKLKITIAGLKKPGTTGAALDGDWVNPNNLDDTGTQQYPSGEGNPGTSFVFRVIVQPGDYNLDNKVDLSDFGTQKANMNKTSGATYAEGDSDGDGDIDLTDFGALKSNMNVDWTSW